MILIPWEDLTFRKIGEVTIEFTDTTVQGDYEFELWHPESGQQEES